VKIALPAMTIEAHLWEKTKKPADIAGLRQALGLFKKIWSGAKGARTLDPDPWQGRASTTELQPASERLAAINSPATGRAMPNAARECKQATLCPGNRPGRTGHNPGDRPPQISPKAAGWGSADCKLGRQAPI